MNIKFDSSSFIFLRPVTPNNCPQRVKTYIFMYFTDEAGNKFRFVNGVDGPPRYSILNYQRDKDGTYRWHVVGNYTRKSLHRFWFACSLHFILFNPQNSLFDYLHILVHFRCSISNVHNFGRNRHFLIFKKANESSFSLVSFSSLEMIFKTFESYIVVSKKRFFKEFFQNNAKSDQNFSFLSR